MPNFFFGAVTDPPVIIVSYEDSREEVGNIERSR